MRRILQILCLLWIVTFSQGQIIFEKITTISGPEDMVIDSSQEFDRLLISTSDRRNGTNRGEIQSYSFDSGQMKTLVRVGEPADMAFNPHGIYMADIESKPILYVISHDNDHKRHPVIRYEVKESQLLYIDQLWSPLMVSPNAITVFPDGSFLVCNDAAKRGNMMEKILMQKKSTIVFYDGLGEFSIVADKLGMPAGMNRMGNIVYVSAATENKIYSFTFCNRQLSDKQVLCKVKGPDNIRFSNGQILVACHEKTMKFIKHVNHADSPSPTAIYRVDPRTGKKERIFHDDGKLISAGSVAVAHNGNLYIGQIFGNYLVKMTNPQSSIIHGWFGSYHFHSDRKPHFHPLLSPSGTVLTAESPPDHLWHMGLWFSWKFIDGLNYWEYSGDPKNHISEGRTEILNTKIDTLPSGDIKIGMEIGYGPWDHSGEFRGIQGNTVMKEKRNMMIRDLGADGYMIDYEFQFTALKDLLLDRTPIPGEPGGQSWGGYSGLSFRFNTKFSNIHFFSGTTDSLVSGDRSNWAACDFTNENGGQEQVILFDHPDNPRFPTPWYCTNEPRTPMYFFSPAILYFKPLALANGETLHLKYKVFIPSQALSRDQIDLFILAHEWPF